MPDEAPAEVVAPERGAALGHLEAELPGSLGLVGGARRRRRRRGGQEGGSGVLERGLALARGVDVGVLMMPLGLCGVDRAGRGGGG